MNLKSSKFVLLTALSVVACGKGATDAEDAQDAYDTTQSTSNEGALMDMATTDQESSAAPMCSLSSDALGNFMVARFNKNVKDASCLTVTQNGSSVDYKLNACTGRYGKVTVTGTITVVYTMNTDCSIDAVGTGKGVQVNKATVDLDATAHYTKDSNGLEKVVVTSHTKGGTDSVELDHMGSYTVTRDASDCRTLEGNWSTDWSTARANAQTSTTASGLKRCGDSCPVTGGTVVHNGFLGRVVTLTFDGSATAKWSSNKGKSGTISLDCTPQ